MRSRSRAPVRAVVAAAPAATTEPSEDARIPEPNVLATTDGDLAPLALAVTDACQAFGGAALLYGADPADAGALPRLAAASDDLAAVLGALPAFAPAIVVGPSMAVMGLDDIVEVAAGSGPAAARAGAVARAGGMVAFGLEGLLAEATSVLPPVSDAMVSLSLGVPFARNAAFSLMNAQGIEWGASRPDAPAREADERATLAGADALWRGLVRAANEVANAGSADVAHAMRRLARLLELVPRYDPPFAIACVELSAALQAAAPAIDGNARALGEFVGLTAQQLVVVAGEVMAAEEIDGVERGTSVWAVGTIVRSAMRVLAIEAGAG